MCDNGCFEISDKLKCDICHKKPAVGLIDPDTKEKTLGYAALCEKCGIKVFGKEVVTDWAGTKLYIKAYPESAEAWGYK